MRLARRAAALAVLCAAMAGGGAAPAASDQRLDGARERLERGDWAGALSAARDLLAEDPKEPRANYIAGVASEKLGRLADAERHLQKARRAAPDAPEVSYHLGSVLLAMADDFLARGREKIALDMCEEAWGHFEDELTRSPGHAGALEGRARALLKAGRVEPAIEAYEAWIAATPDQADARLALVGLYVDRGRAGEALRVLEALPAGTESDRARAETYLVARLLYQQGRPEEARALVERIRAPGVEPWRIDGLEALDRIARGDARAAAAALLRFMEGDPPRDELTAVARAYHERSRALQRAAEEGGAPPAPEDDTVPRLLLRVPPDYPEDARRYGVEGEVLVLAVVGPDGAVGDSTVISCTASKRQGIYEPQFEAAAVDAIRQWLYEPASREGQPVAFPVTIAIGFTRE